MKLDQIFELINDKNYAQLKTVFSEMKEVDIAEIIDETDINDAVLIFRLLPKSIAADVFAYLDMDVQTKLSELVSEDELKKIVQELNFDDKIDLIEEMPANVVKKILENSPKKERALINQFLNYPEDSAGSIMTIEFVDLKKEMTILEAISRIRRIGIDKETIYTCYVTDTTRTLHGIISLKQLVLADTDATVEQIMETDVIYVNTHDDQEIIARTIKKYDFLSLPVVDNEGRLVGIITIDDVVDVIDDEVTEDFQKMAATIPSDEEYMTTKPLVLARRRIMWLVILMFSAGLTEFISNTNSSLTREFVMLVGVMPMLMSTGGNAGAQASTLVIRGLTLGDVKFKDFFRVISKELRVGVIIGVTLGILNFTRIMFFYKNFKLAVIVGFTLIGTTTMAALMGGSLPILAKKLKLDPAIMASPLITTITDATTLLLFFAIAAFILL